MRFRIFYSSLPLFFIASILTLALTRAEDAPRQYVRDLEDFRVHIESHRRQVEILGMESVTHHRELAREYLKLHDQSKLKDTILRKLYRFYGVKRDQLKQHQLKELEITVKALNNEDNRIAMQFFRQHHLLTPKGEPSKLAKWLKKWEQIADLVARSSSPVAPEEFARPMKPASEFLSDPNDKKLAKTLEEKYAKLVKNATYEAVRTERCLKTAYLGIIKQALTSSGATSRQAGSRKP